MEELFIRLTVSPGGGIGAPTPLLENMSEASARSLASSNGSFLFLLQATPALHNDYISVCQAMNRDIRMDTMPEGEPCTLRALLVSLSSEDLTVLIRGHELAQSTTKWTKEHHPAGLLKTDLKNQRVGLYLKGLIIRGCEAKWTSSNEVKAKTVSQPAPVCASGSPSAYLSQSPADFGPHFSPYLAPISRATLDRF